MRAAAAGARAAGERRALATGRALCGALYGARVAQAADARVLAALLRLCLPERALAQQWAPPAAPHALPYTDRLQVNTRQTAYDE